MLLPTPHAGAALALLLCGAACGSAEEDPDAGGPAATVSCQADPRLDVYDGSLDKAGELGVLSFHFSELEPSPPAKGLNVFRVRVNDGAGATMDGELGVDPTMPDHGHGTSVEPIIEFDDALGTYTVRQLFLFMPGVWRIEFEAYAGAAGEGAPTDGPPLDSVELHFCIEG